MAGEWLKFEASTPEKPEVFAITVAMGWDDPDLTVGKLLKVWRWFDQQTINGNAANVTLELLDRITGVTGFAKSMCNVGWLFKDDAGLRLPNFDKHNGNTAKNRSETAKRVANHRSKKVGETPAFEKANIPRPIRSLVMERDRKTCVYCGRKEGEYAPPEVASDAFMCLDHVIPETRNGSNDPTNLVCACSVCNKFKSDRTPDECGLTWPVDSSGNKFGNVKHVTSALPREEKRREENKEEQEQGAQGALDGDAAPVGVKSEPKFDPKAALTDGGVEKQQAADFLQLRKTKKAPLTMTALEGIQREAAKAGINLAAAVAICCENGWAGFKADWHRGAGQGIRPTGRPSINNIGVAPGADDDIFNQMRKEL